MDGRYSTEGPKSARRFMLPTMRPCERVCRKCGEPLHHSRFRARERSTPHGSVWEFNPNCKACEQIVRNERKNTDRAKSIIERRAADRAARFGVSKYWFLINMNWQSLVPIMRAMMTDEAKCVSCGHRFDNERDIHIEHREPPRFDGDWARESARNIGILCQSCNATKQDRDYSQWLDDMEGARVSNEKHRQPMLVGGLPGLFDVMVKI